MCMSMQFTSNVRPLAPVPSCFMPNSKIALLVLATIFSANQSQAQWVPPATLRDIPVFDDCNKTRHGIGVSVQPALVYPHGAIFMCPERERAIDARNPGASRFFLVHEYGHLAMNSRQEAIADEWAAKQLAGLPAEKETLRAVILHFVDQGTLFDPRYGSGFDRALRVARAAGIPVNEWPRPLIEYADAQEKAESNGASLALRVVDVNANAAEMVIVLDNQTIGVLSNLDGTKPLNLPEIAPGHHVIQASQVWLYRVDSSGAKSEIARRLQAGCNFESTGKKAVALDLRFDGDAVSIQAVELR
jgi:hypothetical protein